MRGYARIVNKKVVECDFDTWAKEVMAQDKFESERRVANTEIGERQVSTVFLGMDHSWNPNGPPLWFETMVFSSLSKEDPWEHYTERYSTYEEAEAGHKAIVEKLQKNELPEE